MKRDFRNLFYSKKSLNLSVTTILLIILATLAFIFFGWGVVEAANRIFK